MEKAGIPEEYGLFVGDIKLNSIGFVACQDRANDLHFMFKDLIDHAPPHQALLNVEIDRESLIGEYEDYQEGSGQHLWNTVIFEVHVFERGELLTRKFTRVYDAWAKVPPYNRDYIDKKMGKVDHLFKLSERIF